MKAYKGFNKDMTCRGFQYKEGETYETDKAKVCKSGFHACENPLDCLQYYGPGKSVYHEVELDGEIDRRHDGDTKVATTKIKIGAELSIPALCKATFEYVRSKCTNEHNAEAGKAATAGDRGAATSRGSVAVGENGVATVRATFPKIKGGLGAMLTIAQESECTFDIVAWTSFVIDGKKYKPDTWYTMKGGKVVKTEEGEQ